MRPPVLHNAFTQHSTASRGHASVRRLHELQVLEEACPALCYAAAGGLWRRQFMRHLQRHPRCAPMGQRVLHLGCLARGLRDVGLLVSRLCCWGLSGSCRGLGRSRGARSALYLPQLAEGDLADLEGTGSRFRAPIRQTGFGNGLQHTSSLWHWQLNTAHLQCKSSNLHA